MRAGLSEVGQELEAEIRREQHGHEPRGDERKPDDPEDPAGIFAGARLGEPDRQEARCGDERAGEHRERGRGPGIGCGACPVEALLHLHHHHFDGDNGVIDQKPERDDEGAERDAMEIEAGRVHHHEDDREHQRHR